MKTKINNQIELLKSKLSKEEFELFEKRVRESKGKPLKEYFPNVSGTTYTFEDLIYAGFRWSATTEGIDYWSKISER